MKYLKYVLILVVLLATHFFLDSGWLVASWCCLGVILGFVCRNEKWLLLKVLMLEVLVGIFFRLFVWNDGWDQLAYHVTFSPLLLTVVVIGVNLVTLVLCVSVFYYSIKWFLRLTPAGRGI